MLKAEGCKITPSAQISVLSCPDVVYTIGTASQMCELLGYSCDVLDMFKQPKFESICGKVMYYYITLSCTLLTYAPNFMFCLVRRC